MAFSTQDIEVLRKAKQEGKTKEQALAALAQARQSQPSAPAQPDQNSARADLAAGFQGAKDVLAQGMDRDTAIESEGRGRISELFGKFTSGTRAAGEALGSIGEGVVRALPGGTTAVNTLGDVASAGAEAVSQSRLGQAIGGAATGVFESLPEGAQRTLGDLGNLAIGGAGIAGTAVAPGVATTVGRTALTPVKTAMRNTKPVKITLPSARAGELITKYRTQLSDINPQYETVLKSQTDPSKTLAYFDQAEKAALDPSVPMATTLASKQAVNAFEAIDRGASEAGKLKSELLDSIATEKIPGNIAGNSIDNVKQTINQRYGIDIDKQGNIRQAEGRMASVDAKSQKLISEYVTMLRQLGQSPTARQLDDFVDATQRMLYKQSSPNLFDVADEPVIAFLKQQTGEINSQLKSNVDAALEAAGKPPIYGELNTEYANLLEINNALNKRLGVEGDKGASLMKSLFSPQTGEPTRRLFQQIKEETGIDLFEEATLAKFAMESVGDTRSKSLLQSIDETVGDVSRVNLMEPGSWIQFIREKADLDGRELAEAIIKQATSESQK